MMTQLMVAIGVPSSSSAVAESALRPPFFEVAVSSIVLVEEPPAKENVAAPSAISMAAGWTLVSMHHAAAGFSATSSSAGKGPYHFVSPAGVHPR